MRRLALLAALAGATTGCAPAAPPARRPPTTTMPTLPTTTAPATTTTLAPTTAPPTTARRRAPVATTTTVPTEGMPGQDVTLEAIAQCESGGEPTRVSRSGKYRGKYQFDQRTWESVGGTGDPAAASEAEQDARAARLYANRGGQPWPNCP